MDGKILAALGALAVVLVLVGRRRLVRTVGYKRGTPFDLDLEEVDGHWLASAAARRYVLMRDAAKREGVPLYIESAFRSFEEQRRLFDMSPEERAQNRVGGQVARPGYSIHQTGNAVDVGPRDSDDWVRRNATRFGFQQTVPSEPWHLETLG